MDRKLLTFTPANGPAPRPVTPRPGTPREDMQRLGAPNLTLTPAVEAKRRTRYLWIIRLQIASVLLHTVMFIASLVLRLQPPSETVNTKAHIYEYYKPEIIGDNSTMAVSAIRSLNMAYTQRCNRPPVNSSTQILALESTFTANNRQTHVRLSWVPLTFQMMGHDQIDGYVLLMLIFGFSAAFEAVSCYWVYESEQEPSAEPKYTEMPCMWRWMEYAVTSPIMILLVASSLMIRDIYTLYMLVLAQAALVQLGFAVEYAIHAKVNSPSRPLQYSDLVAIDYNSIPETAGMLQSSATHDYADTRLEREVCMIDRLFWFTFSPAWILHGAIWAIIMSTFDKQQSLDCENENNNTWRSILLMVIVTQFLFFSSFAVVSFFQAVKVKIIDKRIGLPKILQWLCPWAAGYEKTQINLNFTEMLPNFLSWFKFEIPALNDKMVTRDVMSWGFWYYSFLSLVVKILLGGTYMGFVTMFPFSTAGAI